MRSQRRFSPVRRGIVFVVVIACYTVLPVTGPRRVIAAPPSPSERSTGAAHARPLASLPLRFELNEGQAGGDARFLARTRDGLLAVTPTAALLRVRRPAPRRDHASARRPLPPAPRPAEDTNAVVRIATAGSNPLARVTGLDQLPGVTNYFLGNDPSKWRTNVPGFARVKVEGVYSGIDLVYYGAAGGLEYDFDVAPGADPNQIALSIDGADSVAVDASGDLVLRTAVGEVRQHAPKIYQDIDGIRHEVAGGYVIRNEREVGFELAAYDATRPLVIDPQLVYATYLGGSSDDGDTLALAVDDAGSAYICGSTDSTDFPTKNPFQSMSTSRAGRTAFVTKLSPDGSSLVYSTYLGGSSEELGYGVAVNSAGEAYVTGVTSSDDFPIKNAIQPQRGLHSQDAFVTKLSADGASLVFSTYLGGTGNDVAYGIELDPDSNAYVFGTTTGDFPVKNASQTTYGGGIEDGFVSIIDATGSTLLASTYFGGNGDDEIQALTIDPGNDIVCVSGYTTSTDLPQTGSSVSSKLGGSGPTNYVMADWEMEHRHDLSFLKTFVVLATERLPGLSPTVSQFVRQVITGLLVGLSNQGPASHKEGGSPAQSGAFVATYDEEFHQIASGGIAIPGQNFLGGLAVGPNGAVYATGATDSAGVPLFDPIQNKNAGGFDGYVVAFAPGSLAPVFSTYLGGSDDDYTFGIAVDPQGNIYVLGDTSSTDFPTAGEPFQGTAPPSYNAFITKISPVTFAPDFALSADPPSITASRGQKGQITIDVTRTAGFDGTVTVKAPATAAIKVKLTPASASTSGDHVTFTYKVKKKAKAGTYDLTFTGKDDQNRERSATLTLLIQ